MGTDSAFEVITQEPRAAFDFLARKFLDDKQYSRLFETRLMQKRYELGLPLTQTSGLDGTPDDKRPALEQAFADAAREVGGLYLAAGDIPRAWSYYRAIGESAPIATALDRLDPGEDLQAIIEIAFHEGAHPRKGFELVLEHYGLCRAISYYQQFPGGPDRVEALHLLVRTLHGELIESLRRTIEQAEGQAPSTKLAAELIAGREWLFGEFSYYVDTSHLVSILQFSLGLEDREMVALALDLAEYGQHLSSNFHYRNELPFEDYIDYILYFRALLGRDLEAAIDHFRHKDTQVLVELFARIGDFERLAALARERDDLLTFTAALLQQSQRL
jgi:hypothetical protein